MVGWFDVGHRARARATLRRLLESAEGARLPAPPRRGRPRRAVSLLIRIAGILAVVAVIGGLTLAVRLAEGPIHLDGLHDRIAASLQERTGNRYSVELGPTFLAQDAWGVGLGFSGVKLRDANGRVVLSAPQGKIGLDAWALLMAQLKVRRIELDDLSLRLRVAANGTLSIAMAGAGEAPIVAVPHSQEAGLESATLAAMIRAGAEAMAGASQAIDRLSLTNAHFVVDNEATGRTVAYKNFNLVFDRSGDKASAKISATGASGPWTISARATVGELPTLALEARDLSLADLEAFDKRPPPLFCEGPISFRLNASLKPNGAVDSLTGAFAVGAGRVRLNNPDALPFLIDEASGRIRWEGDGQRLQVEELVVLAGETHLSAYGWIIPPADRAAAWIARLESKSAVFGPERQGEKPVTLTSLVAEARFIASESRLVVDALDAKGPTVDAGLKATVAPDGAGVSLKLDIKVRPSVTPDVVRLWPQFVNPDLRDWCSQNLHGGQIEGSMSADWSAADLEAMDHKRPVPRESVRGVFSTRDVGVDLLPGLPMMRTSLGSGSFTGRDFSVSGKGATMVLSPSRRLQADSLVFTVPDTAPQPIIDAEARAHLVGSADSIADLLSREPLRKQAGLQIDPATVHGQAEGDLALALKLGKTAKPEDTQFHVAGTLSNLTLDKFIGEEKFEQAKVAVEADRSTLKMTGEGQLFGAPTRIDVARAPGDEGSATLALTLDEAARAKRGLDLDWLAGPLPVKIKAPLSRTSADVEIDLTQAEIKNPVPGVAKAAGKPGKATFQAKPAPPGAALSAVDIEFGSVLLRGTANVGVDGAVLDGKFAQARISPGDDFRIEVVNGPTAIKASVRGASLDARPFIKSLAESGSPSERVGKDLDIDMKIASAAGANKQTIAGLELNSARRGGEDRLVSLRGRIGQGLVGASRTADGDLRLVASDAGALLKFTDLYSRMEGGALDLVLRTGGGTSQGAATVANFLLRDEPAFRKLVAAAPAQNARSVDPAAIRFQRMKVDFERSAGIVEIRDAIIHNQSMGITTAGAIDFAHDEIDLSGTFVPAYSLNSMLSKIPVVGLVLGGGQNEGVFGVTYRVHGAFSQPQLAVDPLSAIAPGILRKILGVVDGTGPLAGPAPTPSTRSSGAR
ncbi:MAG TPA: AsmA-like C-terminal domain-containing protein [Roseiarcus sp.]|nr:AsmA-like C-terminal domain-containing protein [Roseiarcus sp.]